MARTITGPERALLAAAFALHLRVEVQNDDDTWIDLSVLGGANFVEGVSWSEDIDTPIAGANVRLTRQVSNVSLAPLVEDSPANVDDDEEYAPLLSGGRGIRVHTACTIPGEAPEAGDWKLVFQGKIDAVDWGQAIISLTCRDLGARLADTFIEDEAVFAEPENPVDEGVVLEDVIQAIIDTNGVPGSPTLVSPASSAFVIRPYRQQQQSVLDAIRTLSLQRGWDLRYRFGAGDANALTLLDPDRSNTTPDFTLPPSEYLDVSELSYGDADIRNKIRIKYLDRDTGQVETFDKQDNDSIAVYGTRFMEIEEASTSAIDTEAEADAMASAALDDLSSPYATHQIELPYFWPVQLHDIVALPENFVHYDVPQIMAVVSISHSLSDGAGKTTIRGRGKPAGAFMEWLRRAGQGRQGTELDSRMPVLLNFKIKQQTATTRTYSWTRGRLTAQVWVGMVTLTVDQLESLEPWQIAALNARNTPPLGDAVNEITVLMPKDGQMFFMQVEPRGADLFAGEVRRVTIEGTPAPFEYQAIATDHEDGTAKLQVTVEDPRGVVQAVRFWRTLNNIRTGPITATSIAPPVYAYNFAQHPKHATLVQIEFVRNDGEPNLWSDVFSFDRDDVPEIQSANVSYALDQATVIVDGDTDTVSLWYAEVIDGEPEEEVELDYRGDESDPRFGFFTVTASTENKRLFRVYAKNADGEVGVYREVEINQFEIAARFVQCIARMTAVTEFLWTVEVDVLSPIEGSPTVELLSIEGSATVQSGAAIGTPVAAPATWVFNRTAGLGLPSWALFEGAQAGMESDQDSIVIPEIGQDTIPMKLRAIPLVSSDRTKQLVRVVVAEPGTEDLASVPNAFEHISLSYESEGAGAITHSFPDGGGSGGTDNPLDIPYANSELEADTAARTNAPFGTLFNYVDFEIERPAHGSDPGRVSFLVTAEGRAPDADHITILPVDRLQLQVDIEQVDQDAEEVEVTVTVTDPTPGAGDYITLTPTKTANIGDLTPSSSGALPNGGTRSFLIPLPAFRSGKGQVVFTATASDRIQGSSFIDIPEMAPDPAGNLTLAIDEAGGLDANVQGDSEIKSWLYLASNSAMPDDATVISTGTLVNARDLALQDLVVVPNPGRGYFKAVPYYFTSAVGDPGLPLSGYADRADTIGAPLLNLADPDEGGDVDWDLSGHSATASYRLAFASSPPSDATIRAATAVNAQSAAGTYDANLDFGEELHGGAFAYSDVDGGGTESPVARHQVKRQNKVTSKIFRIAATEFLPYIDDVDGATVRPASSGQHVEAPLGVEGIAFYSFSLPTGVVITGIAFVVQTGHASDNANINLRKLPGDGGAVTSIATVDHTTDSAWHTASDLALDEDVAEDSYQLLLQLSSNNAGNLAKVAEVFIYYDSPDLAASV